MENSLSREQFLQRLKELSDELELMSSMNFSSARTEDVMDVITVGFNVLREKLAGYDELKKEYEKFKLALDNASDHIMITDVDGEIQYTNRAAEKNTGYTISEMVGSRPSLWGERMGEEFYQNLWKTIKEKREIFIGEVENQKKSGEKYIASLHIAPVIDSYGKLHAFVGIERDITRRKKIDQAKSEYVSLASHQLKSPLTTIRLLVDHMLNEESDGLSERHKELLKDIDSVNRRMMDLVQNFLDASRIDIGALAAEPKKCDLRLLIKETQEDLATHVLEKKITFQVEHDPNLAYLYADPSLVRIVLQNLFSNAIKYSSHGGVVYIRTERKEQEGIICVKDTGLGIPEAEQESIFDKMYRASNTQSRVEGTGLGLYIVKAMINESAGRIWFHSRENEGTEFFVAFPIAT